MIFQRPGRSAGKGLASAHSLPNRFSAHASNGSMATLLPAALWLTLAGGLFAQYPGLTLPPSGNNQKASVVQHVGPVRVSIDYSSPAVHGPDGKDRRGQIWGKLVPYGLSNLGFGNGKPAPWRAGANENTVFAISHDVSIEGKPLAAGRYGLHMIPGPEEWTLIFSRNAEAWGSFFYEESQDALRVQVKPKKHEYREWLTYEFTERRPTEAIAELQWEDLSVPWKIQVAGANDIYLSHLRRELTSSSGFSYQAYVAAAQFCLQSGTDLEQGLKWAEASVSMPFIGQANFNTLSTKAQLLSKLGREQEADKIMQAALRNPSTTAFEIHQYGRQLLAARKPREALEVFQYNAQRNGDKWPVHVGLARGYAATGNYAQALEHAKKALPQAPDDLNRNSLQGMIKALSENKPIAQ
jgi:tetratricopeptide (TPR) repeat protein